MTYGHNGPWEEIPLYSLRFARLFIFKRMFGFDNSIYNPGPDIGSGLRFEPFIDLKMGSDLRLYRFFVCFLFFVNFLYFFQRLVNFGVFLIFRQYFILFSNFYRFLMFCSDFSYWELTTMGPHGAAMSFSWE